MLAESLPKCPCGCRKFKTGGSSAGGMVTQQWFTCTACLSLACVLFSPYGGILTFLDISICPVGARSEREPPEVYTTWVDKVMFPTWRDRQSHYDAFYTFEWDRWIEVEFRRAFPECDEYPKGKFNYYDLPEAAQAFIRATWGEGERVGSYLGMPAKLAQNVYPPQVPQLEGASFYTQVSPIPNTNSFAFGDTSELSYGDLYWQPVNLAFSATLPVPEDPLLRYNRAFFLDVWKQVAENIGRELPDRQESPNQYGGSEPWFTFESNDRVFTVGWRHRVVSIQVEAPKGIDTDRIQAVANQDRVTYSAGGAGHTVRQIEVHAWSKAKVVEYLTILILALNEPLTKAAV